MFNLEKQLSQEFNISEKICKNTLDLIKEGASIPFIARYRKEQTRGLSDQDLRNFQLRQKQLVELENSKTKLLEKLKLNDQLSNELIKGINNCLTKKQLDDLYAPFKSNKESAYDQARRLGFEPLANTIWVKWRQWNTQEFIKLTHAIQPTLSEEECKQHIYNLIAEPLLNLPSFMQACEDYTYHNANIHSRLIRGKKEKGEKFQDYFDYCEAINKVPSHRALALLRGKKENILKLSIKLASDEIPKHTLSYLGKLTLKYAISPNCLAPLQKDILNVIWQNKIIPKTETSLLTKLKEKSELEAVRIFSQNLEALLMAPPAGHKRIMALDPGFKNGVKIAVIDEQGTFLKDAIIYPHPPQNQKALAEKALLNLIKQFQIDLIALGNGTASRETDRFLSQLIKQHKLITKCVTVNESGASIYSASELASKEFPNLDVTIRGAISIARRLQDPLSELIKIDPESIGVGQYQHDIKSSLLKESLNIVIEDCVNAVGVDLNSASASLLTHVSGLSKSLAQNIVDYRQEKGAFKNRLELKKVKGIGSKSFEHSAGFLRIQNAQHPLDASAVHPESYQSVATMAKCLNLPIGALINNQDAINELKSLRSEFAEIDNFTFDDIMQELAKPGRDPRAEFKYASFDQNVESISDLTEGLELEGVATNIAAFGVFVDIGVHQDGLVHISQLANRFIKDPASLVKVGDILKVKVLDVDKKRKRISLQALGL